MNGAVNFLAAYSYLVWPIVITGMLVFAIVLAYSAQQKVKND